MVNTRSILPVQLRGVRVSRKDQRLVGPVDLTLEGGGCTILMGANGAGKSTLLRVLHGVQRLSAGEVRWSAPEARDHRALVAQTPTMLRRNVIDNIAYPLRLNGVGRAAARAMAREAAEKVGLAALTGRSAGDLSGGERARLAIARALIRSPQLLILDEPCASLDPRSVGEIEDILIAERDAGLRIIMSTHMIGQARRLAREVVFLHNGRITDHLPAEQFLSGAHSPAAAAYLKGELFP